MTKFKRLKKFQMDGVYTIVCQLPARKNQRYDIGLNLKNEYSLILHTDLSNDKSKIMIEPCDGENFIKKLIEFWQQKKTKRNSNTTIEDRLKSVIAALEFNQSKDYNSLTNLTLSYLYDILNDTVPKHILEIKKVKK